jgi:preprotein translocase subunit SecG
MMGFAKEHFAEVTLIWLSVLFVGIVIALGYYPLADKDTVAWIRSVAGGFTYALLLALKIKAGVTSDTQTTNTNTTNTKVDKKEGE